MDAAVGAGAIAAPSARAVAERCEIVLLCVQTDEQCMAAVCGDDGALAGARPGGCIAVISTVLPATIATLAAQAAGRSVALVDTPVAGRGMFSIGEGNMSVLVGDDVEIGANSTIDRAAIGDTVIERGVTCCWAEMTAMA